MPNETGAPGQIKLHSTWLTNLYIPTIKSNMIYFKIKSQFIEGECMHRGKTVKKSEHLQTDLEQQEYQLLYKLY